MEKTEIADEKSKGTRYSVWRASEKYGLLFKAMKFIYSLKSVQLIWIHFLAGSSATTLISQDFLPVGLFNW